MFQIFKISKLQSFNWRFSKFQSFIISRALSRTRTETYNFWNFETYKYLKLWIFETFKWICNFETLKRFLYIYFETLGFETLKVWKFQNMPPRQCPPRSESFKVSKFEIFESFKVSMFQVFETCKVSNYLKRPKFQIWNYGSVEFETLEVSTLKLPSFNVETVEVSNLKL